MACVNEHYNHRSLRVLVEVYPVLHYISGVQIADFLGSVVSHAFALLKRVKEHEEGTLQIMRWRGNFF